MENNYNDASVESFADPISSMSAGQALANHEADALLKVLLESEDLLTLLEHEFRGEILETRLNKEGEEVDVWVKRRTPIVPSNQGIDEILRMLRFMGLNKVSVLTNLNETLINNKLKDFELRLAELMFLKRKKWKIDKREMAMTFNLIKSIVEDAIYRSKDGSLVKTLRSTFNRTEYEDTSSRKGQGANLKSLKNPFSF